MSRAATGARVLHAPLSCACRSLNVTAACEPLHRIDEAVVKEQVERAGFKLADESAFLRNPSDPRDWNADPSAKDPRVHTQDLFALKFVKP